MDQHTGAKWLIDDTKQPNAKPETLLHVTLVRNVNLIREFRGSKFNPVFSKKVGGEKHPFHDVTMNLPHIAIVIGIEKHNSSQKHQSRRNVLMETCMEWS